MELIKLTIEQIAETSESLADQLSRHGIREMGYDGESMQFLSDDDAETYWAGEFGDHVAGYWERCGRPPMEAFADIMNGIQSIIDQVSPALPTTQIDFGFESSGQGATVFAETPQYMAIEIGVSPTLHTLALNAGFDVDDDEDDYPGWFAIIHIADELRDGDFGDDGRPLSSTIEGYFVAQMFSADSAAELFDELDSDIGEENLGKMHMFASESERELFQSMTR
jgi:hypothetical protein